MRLFRLGLRGRAIVFSVLLVVCTGAAISVALIWTAYRDSVRAVADHAVINARALSHLAEPAVLLNDEHALARIVRGMSEDAAVQLARVSGLDGRVLARFQRDLDFAAEVFIDPMAPIPGRLTSETARLEQSANQLTVVVPVWPSSPELDLQLVDEEAADEPAPAKQHAIGYVTLVCSFDRIKAELTRRTMSSALVAGLVILMGVAGTVVMVRRLLTPVRELGRTTLKLAGGDLTGRAPDRGAGEIGQLARSFNHMADRLQESYASIERKVVERTSELEDERAKLQTSEARLRAQNAALVELTSNESLYEGDFPRAVKSITEVAARTLDVARASVWFFEDDRNVLKCRDLYELSDDRHSFGLAMRSADCPVYIAALEEGRAIAANDCRVDPRTVELVEGHIGPLGIWSLLDAPIRIGAEIVGVVCLEQVGHPRHWSAEEEHFAGSIADMVTLALEASERRWAEGQLRESEERHRQVFESVTDAMLISDRDRRVIEANPAACRMYGFTREEFLGLPIEDLVPPDRRSAAAAMWAEFDRQGSFRTETVEVRRNGQEFDVELHGSVVSFRSEQCMLVVARDITERKRAAERLRKAKEEAEQASLAKSEFLANMSHEIRTPMTAITGFSDLLLEDVERVATCSTCSQGGVPDRLTEHIGVVRRNGFHLLEIINDILDLSKVEAGKLKLETLPFAPIQVIHDIRQLMQIRADEKGLALEIAQQGELPARIESDPTRLRQILINLLGNAIKFTESGYVRLNVSAEPGTGSDRVRLYFDISDTGIGMAPEQIERVFRPFAQADTSMTRKYGGTGLGLAVSKRLAEMLGGDVTIVSSEQGVGTTFRLAIEAGIVQCSATEDGDSVPEPAAAKPSVPGDADRLDCRILLVEDGVDNQRLISFVLRKAGAEVAIAENGELGMEAALAAREEGRAFDMILMDMQMPVMDGYTAVSRLRQADYRGPIIALTAHAMSSDRAKCLDVGCDEYTTKPINRTALISLIRSFLPSGRDVTSPVR